MKYELLHDLVGQTVMSLSRVALDERDYSNGTIDMSVLTDTLVFTLSDGRCFELLVSHADTLFEDINPRSGHAAATRLGTDDVETPFTANEESANSSSTDVATREVWTSDGKTRFLVFASYELSTDQQYKAMALELDQEGVNLPWTVSSITEVWGGGDDGRFFAASILWDHDEKPLLSLYKRTDELDVVSLSELHRRLDHMAYYTDSMLYQRYD